MDIQILSTTVSRLKSTDSECISITCTFINEVLLEDFPPEVFLQRPAVIEVRKENYLNKCFYFSIFLISV